MPRRLEEINTFINLAKKTNYEIIIGGDTNARRNDYDNTEIKKYFNDCYKLMNSKDHFTINSNANNFYPNSFKYISRYDRIYITKKLNCTTYNVIFKEKYPVLSAMIGNSGCVSDHYGVMVEIEYL